MKKLLVTKNVCGFGRDLRKGEYLDPELEHTHPEDFLILYGMGAVKTAELPEPDAPKNKNHKRAR